MSTFYRFSNKPKLMPDGMIEAKINRAIRDQETIETKRELAEYLIDSMTMANWRENVIHLADITKTMETEFRNWYHQCARMKAEEL